jgi:hypothetical protein
MAGILWLICLALSASHVVSRIVHVCICVFVYSCIRVFVYSCIRVLHLFRFGCKSTLGGVVSCILSIVGSWFHAFVIHSWCMDAGPGIPECEHLATKLALAPIFRENGN